MNQHQHIGSVTFLASLLLLFIPVGSHAQDLSSPLIISDRVGEIIDPEERTYLGLFPRTTQFASAAAYQVTDSTAAFLITRQAQPTPDTLEVSMASIAELSRFIDHFEYRYRDKYAVNWGLIIRLVHPVDHLHKGGSLSLTLTNGSVVSGRLLHADEYGIVLTDERQYPERLFQIEQASVFAPAEIQHIKIGGMFNLFTPREAHIPEATRGRIYEEYTLPRLQEKVAFPRVPSPEIRTFMDRALSQKTPPPPAPALDHDYLQRFQSRFHLYFSPSLSIHFKLKSLDYRVDFGGHPDFGPGSLSYSVHVPNAQFVTRLEYNISQRIRLGISASNIPASPSQSTLAMSRVEIHGVILHPSITWISKPYEPFPYIKNIPFTPAEVRVSAGPSLAMLEIETGLRSWFLDRATFESSSLFRVGGFSSIELDLYWNRFISIGGGMHASWIPRLRIETIELDNPRTPSMFGTKRLNGTTQSLLMIALQIGLRLHL